MRLKRLNKGELIMKKLDLKTGQRVKLRNGDIYLVLKDVDTDYYGKNEIFFAGKQGFMSGSSYDGDLNYKKLPCSGCDVISVHNVFDNCDNCGNGEILNLDILSAPIWKRGEIKKMTVAEIEKELGYKIMIVKKEKKQCL